MRIVIDSNRFIAALLKDSTTRKILFNIKFDFIAPEFIKEEVKKYHKIFVKKANIKDNEFELLLSFFFEIIQLIPKNRYNKYIKELKSEISDPKDIPFLACCIATDSQGIWSHDPHMKEQNKVKIYTNIDLLGLLKSD